MCKIGEVLIVDKQIWTKAKSSDMIEKFKEAKLVYIKLIYDYQAWNQVSFVQKKLWGRFWQVAFSSKLISWSISYHKLNKIR